MASLFVFFHPSQAQLDVLPLILTLPNPAAHSIQLSYSGPVHEAQ